MRPTSNKGSPHWRHHKLFFEIKDRRRVKANKQQEIYLRSLQRLAKLKFIHRIRIENDLRIFSFLIEIDSSTKNFVSSFFFRSKSKQWRTQILELLSSFNRETLMTDWSDYSDFPSTNQIIEFNVFFLRWTSASNKSKQKHRHGNVLKRHLLFKVTRENQKSSLSVRIVIEDKS